MLEQEYISKQCHRKISFLKLSIFPPQFEEMLKYTKPHLRWTGKLGSQRTLTKTELISLNSNMSKDNKMKLLVF